MLTGKRLSISVWPGWVLMAGTEHSRRPHRHYLHQILISLDGMITLNPGTDTEAHSPVFLVPGNTVHRCIPNGMLVSVFIEPSSPWGRSFATRLREGVPLSLQGASGAAVQNAARESLGLRGNDFPALELLASRICIAAGLEADAPSTEDSRITALAERLRSQRGALSLHEAARWCRLSSSRFSHLFSLQAGVSWRRYQVWVRLMEGLSRVIMGEDLTDAALNAGFSDFSHFSRVLRENFGVGFREIFQNSGNVQVFLKGLS